MSNITKPKAYAWDQQPNETDKAYRAFRHYLGQGPKRSLGTTSLDLGYHAKSKKVLVATTIAGWSKKYGWIQRIKAYEGWIGTQQDQTIIELEAKVTAKWHARREEIRDKSFELAQGLLERTSALLSKVDTMLSTPLLEKKVIQRGDKTEIHLHPIKWKSADTAHYMRASVVVAREAERLASLAIDMDSGQHDPLDNVDFDQLDDTTLEAISTGKIDIQTKAGRNHVVRLARRISQ